MSELTRAVSVFAGGAQNWTHFDRGIPRYVVEHLRAMHALAPQALDRVLLNRRLPLTGNLAWLLGTGLVSWGGGERPIGGSPGRPSIYHVMSPFEPETPVDVMWPRWARETSVATVVTVYDLIPLIFSHHYLRDPRVRAEYEARASFIRHVDGVLAISQSTADDVVQRLGVPPERVHVIHAGATDIFGAMYATQDAAWAHVSEHLPAVRRGYLLYVGGFEFRKNLETLILGYARMAPEVRRRHQLVIACRMLPDQMELLRGLARDAGLAADDLVLTGYVSDADLGALYHACTLFVFPSLYEGSGLPILEAMACGAPVAATATATGPEILGDREATFDPHSPDAIAGCVQEVLTSDGTLERLARRSRERVAQYTWRRVAQESLLAYERMLPRSSAKRRRRPRIGLVTPWVPEASGIAHYNLRLVEQLSRHADVDVIVSQPVGEYPDPQEDGVRLIHAARLDWLDHVRQLDRIIYCMGNSSFHGYIYDLLRRRPGCVVLHDVRLTGFYGWRAGDERPADPAGWLAERIRDMYGDRIPAEATRPSAPTWDVQLALGIYMTREVQAHSQRCLVHSRFARDVLELERDGLDRQVPVSVVPFGMPAPEREPRSPAPVIEPLIVSLGYVSEVKGLSTLISAAGLLAEQHPGLRLVIAGPADPAEIERWRMYAAEHARTADVEISGWTDEPRYRELLQRADLAVQLRLISNGEASAAVADCLADGVPTIVSDLGWASELPGEAAARVPVGVTPSELARQMHDLLADDPRRAAISQTAIAVARASSFAAVADAYLAAVGLE